MNPQSRAFPFALCPLLAALGMQPLLAETYIPNSDEAIELDRQIESKIDWETAQSHWAFQPITDPDRPAVDRGDWPKTGLDFFTLAEMERRGLEPATPASRRQLARRLSYDLTGLPPDPAWLETVENASDDEAVDSLIERQIGSAAFGERMASLWLNLARYAEDQAHQVGNNTSHFYPNAYRYRAWVIDAFNRDLPYDTFIRLQLAADQLPDTEPEDQVALGFLGLGPKYYNRGRLEVKAEEWSDQVDTVTRSFLGLTVACARCHDHKFDPIPTEDYYSLAGVFASMDMENRQFKTDGSEVTEEEEKSRIHEIHVVKEAKATDLPVFGRGQVDNKGLVTPRRFLRVLSDGPAKPFENGSGRIDLAEAIADPENPLTARVYVNRVWGLFFGQPLSSTPSNFGLLGAEPTHPDLLDDLATRFVASGWSTKWLVREIVNSATYRQSAQADRPTREADPENQWLTRMNRKRVTVEMWRDAILHVAGTLEPTGGASLELNDPNNFKRTVYARVSRLSLNPMLMQFDYPDANVHQAERAATITPTQKLYTLNDPFVLAQAEAFAERLRQSSTLVSPMIEKAYRWCLFRSPTDEEMELSREFLIGASEFPDENRLKQFAHALLISNEALYID